LTPRATANESSRRREAKALLCVQKPRMRQRPVVTSTHGTTTAKGLTSKRGRTS
jgi:hypothetical protein